MCHVDDTEGERVQGTRTGTPGEAGAKLLIQHSWNRKAIQPCHPDAPETGKLGFAVPVRELMQCNLGIPKAQ